MAIWHDRRGRWLATLILVGVVFVSAGAVAAYADSVSDRESSASMGLQPAAAPSPTPGASATVSPEGRDVVEPAIVDDTLVQPTAPSPTAPESQPTVAPPIATQEIAPSAANLIVNGGFEDGSVEGIAVGWERFATGSVQAGWQDDTWDKILYEGAHAQLLALKDARQTDRYVGIFQVVTVAPDTEYLLALHGLVRSDEGSVTASNYGHRLQYGIDLAGGKNWQSSGIQWVELPWDEQPRLTPPLEGYRIETYTATIRSQGPKLTLLIRGWKKWIGPTEGNYDIDTVSLVLARAVQPSIATPSSLPAETPASTVVGVELTPAPKMPQTGAGVQPANNRSLALASILLVVALVAGVVWKLSRHRV